MRVEFVLNDAKRTSIIFDKLDKLDVQVLRSGIDAKAVSVTIGNGKSEYTIPVQSILYIEVAP